MNSKNIFSPEPSLLLPGKLSFDEALALQVSCRNEVGAGRSPGYILLLEHDPPVITLGRHARENNIIVSPKYLVSRGVELRNASRGGDATAHEAGQLVIYYIIPVAAKSSKRFIDAITGGLLFLVSELSGKAARYDAARPGIWIGAKKVASIGLDLTGRVSMHGAAVNVCNSLETFGYINPCGGALSDVSTLSREAGRIVGMHEAVESAISLYREER